MGNCLSRTKVQTENKTLFLASPTTSSCDDIGKTASAALANDIVRILAAQVEETAGSSVILTDEEQYTKRLSEIAERLFMEDLKMETKRHVEMGNEKPIELESEQARRRMQKHRASISVGSGTNLVTSWPRPSIIPIVADPDLSQTFPTESVNNLHKPERMSVVEIEEAETQSSEPQHTMHTKPSNELERSTETIPFQRVFVSGESEDFAFPELRDSCVSLIHALKTRQYYMRLARQNFPNVVAQFTSKATHSTFRPASYPDYLYPMEKPSIPNDEKHWEVTCCKGVVTVIDGENGKEIYLPLANRDTFITNRNLLYALVADGPLKSFCYQRLSYLKNKFGMHRLLNEETELEMMKNPGRSCRRDFYNVRKVDTHIHAAACMSQKHLLGFIQEKAKKEPERMVLKKEGRKMTLREVFHFLHLDPFHLNVDSLDVHADRQTFHRFDRFNNLYSPMGASELREIFLKTNNDINGDYFAEIISQVEQNLTEQKYHLLELRISIYGKSYDEWENLAHWFCSHKLESTHIRWLIQVPRLYDMYKSKGAVETFQQILDNVFRPVMEASVKPHKHKDISMFLRHVIGFDSVDDESKQEAGFMKKSSPTPDQWRRDSNPSYTYYIFYMYANVMRINYLRHSRGMNTFALRPHCGEAGHLDHLLTGFLLAENISHGLVLKKVPVLQYLYYLAQVGICMSPLSNNHLFLEYNKSPFPDYFARGLNVCLSTDDPLQFHFTMEPLMEEYAVAAQVWKLSVCDMCELSRTSVRLSGFSHEEKMRWLGDDYRNDGSAGNDISKTNVPDIRLAFREETLADELLLLSHDLLRQPHSFGELEKRDSTGHFESNGVTSHRENVAS